MNNQQPTPGEMQKELEKLDPKPGIVVSDEQYKEYTHRCAEFIILNYEALRMILSSLGSQTDVEILEAVSLLRAFVSDRSKFGGETIDNAISLLCDVAERGLLKTGER